MTEEITIPKWFKVMAIIAVIWNLMGVIAFAGHMMMTPEMLMALPQAEQDLYKNTPLWATIAFACAVIFGFLGSIFLLLKKSVAMPILIISLVGVLVQMYHSFFIVDSMAVYGPGQAVMPVMVIIIAFALVYMAHKANSQQWLN